MRRWILVRALLAVMLLLFGGCVSKVEETGRSRLLFVSNKELNSLAGNEFEKLKKTKKISSDAEKIAMIQHVSRRIIEAALDRGAKIPSYEDWEILLFEDKNANAFALLGGRIGVLTGLFQYVESDQDLAVIIGHEVAHVVANHSGERISQMVVLQAINLGIGLRMGQDTASSQNVAIAFGIVATVGVALPHSRLNETEADYIGLLYSSQAGYDPRVAIPFWERFSKEGSKNKVPDFLNTHPSRKKRVQKIKEWMPEFLKIYQSYKNEKGN